MLSGVNNNQPSFQGMYILKGKAKTVNKAHRMIIDNCGGKYAELREFVANYCGKTVEEKPYVGFNNIESLNLVNIYSDNQPMVHKLIATNEHVPNIVNWNLTMLPPQEDIMVELMEEPKAFMSPCGTNVDEKGRGLLNHLYSQIKMLHEEMAPYIEAERAAQRGNMDKISDFLIDSMQQLKQRLQEVRDLATVPYSEPKVLIAKDVINAIKENRFNFITGEIK